MGGPDGETRIAARIKVMICHDVVIIIQPRCRTPVCSAWQLESRQRGWLTEVMTEMTKYECGSQESTEGDGGQFDDDLDCPNDANAEQDCISGFYPHQYGCSLS